ncbi:hypothetical protein pdam_00004574 [Pocillopora damicornis]|uniref:HAT C-terminal dimerisation domain-containing protein n=1 Tax=Pocillopora damicornis TaxID=46731 RepID=A0A3M6ULL5_POCDA|nr:hypothetical protein pdam_00004574 [Pocillopora damicornis]
MAIPRRTNQMRFHLPYRFEACDPDIFPNIHLLLRIACTIPVTSTDNEHSNSTLKIVKGYLRPSITDAIGQKFAEQQPLRKLLVDPMFEES